MSTIESPEFITPTPRQLWQRSILYPPIKNVLTRSVVQEVADGIARAEQYLSNGYGLIIPFTHFSVLDAVPIVAAPYFASREIASRPFIAPMEIIQSKQFQLLVEFAKNNFGLTVLPVANPHTRRKMKEGTKVDEQTEKASNSDQTLDTYIKVARSGLEDGAVVAVSIQAGRNPKLEYPAPHVLQKLMITEYPNDKIAIMFMPMSLDEYSPYYGKKHGLSLIKTLGKRYDIRLGPTFTKQELIDLKDSLGWTVDKLAFVISSCLVEPTYNRIPQEDQKSFLDAYAGMFGKALR